jgi:multifunctional methyltransferase subunit TRM112
MLPRLEWSAVKYAADTMGFTDFPDEINSETIANDTELMQKIHHLLLEIEIVTGSLICPEKGRVFPITQGIPNLLLNENEV